MLAILELPHTPLPLTAFGFEFYFGFLQPLPFLPALVCVGHPGTTTHSFALDGFILRSYVYGCSFAAYLFLDLLWFVLAISELPHILALDGLRF